MTFAIFKDARMIYSHMKSNVGFLWFWGDRKTESICVSGGTGIGETECRWCCLWEKWEKKAEGEEHGLKDSGRAWKLGWEGLQRGSEVWQEMQGLCSIRDWRNFWGRKASQKARWKRCDWMLHPVRRCPCTGSLQPALVHSICFSFPCLLIVEANGH